MKSVYGQRYGLRDPDLVLSQLDAYEECGENFPEPTEYVRRKQPVRLNSGETIQAWVYIYNRPTVRLEPIPSGDFLKLRNRKNPSGNKS